MLLVIAVAAVLWRGGFISPGQTVHGAHLGAGQKLASGQLGLVNAGTSQPPAYGIAAGGGLVFLGPEDLEAYFQKLQALGVTWVRWDIDWNVVQPTNATTYNWTAPDRVAAMAQKYHMQSLGIITYTPKWARANACKKDPHCHPASPATFATFAGAVAQHYKDTISTWEIWNEPNYPVFWRPRPSLPGYVALLQAAGTTIKLNNPGATVITGGLAATGDESDGSIGPDTFVQGLYKAGANTSFDAIGIHPYTYPAGPDDLSGWSMWQRLEPIRQYMVDHGDSAKKVWITEYGAPTGGPGTSFTLGTSDTFGYDSDYMQEAAQATMAMQALSFYQARTNWLGPFFWYSLQDEGTARDSIENFFGLLRADDTQKPAYGIYHQAITTQ